MTKAKSHTKKRDGIEMAITVHIYVHNEPAVSAGATNAPTYRVESETRRITI